MKRLLITMGILFYLHAAWSAETEGLQFRLGNHTRPKDLSSNQIKIDGIYLRRAPDYKGEKDLAYEFDCNPAPCKGHLTAQLDISPARFTLLTIALWVKPLNTSDRANIVIQNSDARGRGIGIRWDDGGMCWAALDGSKSPLTGNKVTTQWHFVAAMYNQSLERVWLIVDDQVFKGKTSIKNVGEPQLWIGNFQGLISHLRIYDRMLTVEEISALSGKPLKASNDDFASIVRRDFKKENAEQRLRLLDSLKTRIILAHEFAVYDSLEGKAVIRYLKRGDTVVLLQRDAKGCLFSYSKTFQGRNTEKAFLEDTYPAGTSPFALYLTKGVQVFFTYTSWKSWVIMLAIGIVLFFIYRYFKPIDDWLLGLGRRDEMKATARKGEKSHIAKRSLSLKRYFPIRRFRKWPLLIGLFSAALLFTGALIDSDEMQWFFGGGFTLLPGAEYNGFTWFLWAGTLLILLMLSLLVIESFAAGGWLGGFPRLVFWLIINFFLLVLTFFAFILLIIIVVGIFLVFFGGSLLSAGFKSSSGTYRCSRCGNIFTGDHCPYCS